MQASLFQNVRLVVFIGVIAAVIVYGTGCSRSIQTQPGAQSLERTPATQPPASAGPAAASTAPALSISAQERQSPDSEMVIAKVEPFAASRKQIEELHRDQMATAVAGLKDVYFEFDRWTLTEQGRKALQVNAEWLRANPGKRLTIQGHCDERGTSAYNIVLGEKRAKSVHAYLKDLGVGSNRLTVVSYGKEKPFCQEPTDGCYQQNRRGHLVLEAQ
jgi:peptidoglycan-associated lipoprotein